MEGQEKIQSYALGMLATIDQRLTIALTKVKILNAATDAQTRGRASSEYGKVMQNVVSDREFLDKNFVKSGLISHQIQVVKAKAVEIVRLIVGSLGLNPDDPGLSERVEIKKAATVGRVRPNDVKKALDGLSKIGGKTGATADLAVQLTITLQIAWSLLRRMR